MNEHQLDAQIATGIDPFNINAPAWVAVTYDDDKLDAIAGPFPSAADALAYLEAFRKFEITQGTKHPLSGNALPLRAPLVFP